MSLLFKASKTGWYAPSKTKINAPEIPGKIMAQIASIPARKTNCSSWLVSPGFIPLKKKIKIQKSWPMWLSLLLLHDFPDEILIVQIDLIIDRIVDRIIPIHFIFDVSSILIFILLCCFETSILHYLLL